MEVEFSELPSIDPLTLDHMLGVYIIYSMMIVLSILAWLTEVCLNRNKSIQTGNERAAKSGQVRKILVEESVLENVPAKNNQDSLESGEDEIPCYHITSHSSKHFSSRKC